MDNHPESLSPEESLLVIETMIKKAKNDFFDTGISALLWGSVVIVCSLGTYANYYLQWRPLDYIWFLTIVAVAPQIVISIRESKTRRYKTHEDDLIGGIWVSFGVAIFLFSFIAGVRPIPEANAVFLVLYGIPTFATGFGRRFKPMLIGGLSCWILAVISLYTPFPYVMFLMAAGGLLAWFIPGLILRKCYLQAKRKNV